MTDSPLENEQEEARWPRVYLAVVIYTVALIGALWLFSAVFSR
ncbi:hypothetical protein [Pyrinomonas sp.]